MTVPCHPSALQTFAEHACARLRAASPELAAALTNAVAVERVTRVAIASDFAIEVFERQPWLLQRLLHDQGEAALDAPDLSKDRREQWPASLRRYRQAESVRLIWRDVLDLDDLDTTLAGTTRLAEQCLQIALTTLESEFAQRYGRVRATDGAQVSLVVFALGKLGGSELNFSSDIDLVYAYEQEGTSDGARSLAAEDYFARLGQQLAKLLDEVTADGFCHRVDLRLRPFGSAGRVALSFAAMEQYFQREGRDWERYAWQKARPVAGDLGAGERFLQTLRPFVYRRYLDYGALDGLREMKATIAAEVERKDLADDIKRGPGGIREVEFMAQVLQLIRGGREPALRERRLQPALMALRDARHVDTETVEAMLAAYRFLRDLENRLQMLRDVQTQQLPGDAFDRARIAYAMGEVDWSSLMDRLQQHRQRVTAEFEALLAVRRSVAQPDALMAYWRALPEAGEAAALADAGFALAEDADQALRDFLRSPAVRDLSDSSRARLDRLMPALLVATAASIDPALALRRLLTLLHTILRRTSYLALLEEQPAALTRLIDVLARSALLGDRLAAHPLLLDELLDSRVAGPPPSHSEMQAACAAAVALDDTEAVLLALNEARQTYSFRIALAALDRRQPAVENARRLAWLADAIVTAVLEIALREIHSAHGNLASGRFSILGYGSLGGQELGFGSDLDLVFLYDAPSDAVSDGVRALDAPRWCARLAQKVVALLSTPTAAGRLYDIDVRLRPDGAKGLLVSTLASFEGYQRERAWTWEHQALVRARCVAGVSSLCDDFERVRARILGSVRDDATLRDEVTVMRARMRAELDRSSADRFDLKQGSGGLVDLEFLLQFLILREGHARPSLLAPRVTPELIDALRETGTVDAVTANTLRLAHATLVDVGLVCTLDRRPRIVVPDASLNSARQAITATCVAFSVDFESPTATS